MRKLVAGTVAIVLTAQAANAAGPSAREVERCLRDQFNRTDPALFHNPGNPTCPAFMDLYQISVTDKMVSGNYAQVNVFLRYRLKMAVDGNSFVAESCARGHYGEGRQTFPAGSLWQTNSTITMQRWDSGWKC